MAKREPRIPLVMIRAVGLLANLVEREIRPTEIVDEQVELNSTDLIHKHWQLPGRFSCSGSS